MAAEIGSMAVYQEIDALRTMNIQPVIYLVLPRLVAICISLPVLVIFAILVGWVGGALVIVPRSKSSTSAGKGKLEVTPEVANQIKQDKKGNKPVTHMHSGHR